MGMNLRERGINLEEVSGFPLSDAKLEQLLAAQHECAMTWSTRDGWPMAMMQLFVWERGRIWTTTSGHKKRVKALRRQPKSCVVVSSEGTDMDADQSVAIKTKVTIHEDQETRQWLYGHLTNKMHPEDEGMREILFELLDSPRRVVLEHEPVKFLSYDGTLVQASIMEKMAQ
jgi:general stress protein 26